VRYAFSRKSEKSEGCKYVQDRFYHDRKDVVELFASGAKIFVCGSRNVGEAVGITARKIYKERAEELGKPHTEESAEEWFKALRNERFATDVFD
jgi:cytochrome P450/NADPH-cytochrome P450 reductase